MATTTHSHPTVSVIRAAFSMPCAWRTYARAASRGGGAASAWCGRPRFWKKRLPPDLWAKHGGRASADSFAEAKGGCGARAGGTPEFVIQVACGTRHGHLHSLRGTSGAKGTATMDLADSITCRTGMKDRLNCAKNLPVRQPIPCCFSCAVASAESSGYVRCGSKS